MLLPILICFYVQCLQLQHLVEVILVHVHGVCGVAYLQVGVVQVWQPGGCVVARRESGSLKQWSMVGFDQAEVGCVRRMQRRSPLNQDDFRWNKLK